MKGGVRIRRPHREWKSGEFHKTANWGKTAFFAKPVRLPKPRRKAGRKNVVREGVFTLHGYSKARAAGWSLKTKYETRGSRKRIGGDVGVG